MTALYVSWALPCAVAALIAAPVVVLGRGRVQWQKWELFVFILPFALWFCLLLLDQPNQSKSFVNVAVEPYLIAVAIPLAVLVRVLVGKRAHQVRAGVVLVASVCAIAVLTFFCVPLMRQI